MTWATAPDDTGPQIWFADLDALEPVLEEAETVFRLLAPSEVAWTEPSRTEARVERRLTRIALRILLIEAGASLLPGSEFVIDAAGKPLLGLADLHFSLAHTRSRALFAIARRGPLGIDLEIDREVQLGPDRRRLIEAAAHGVSPGIPPGILGAWTCLEAFAKARGSGIGVLLSELGFTASRVRTLSPEEASAAARTLMVASGLEVVAIELPQGHHGAIAAPVGHLAQPLWPSTLDAAHCRYVMRRFSATAR